MATIKVEKTVEKDEVVEIVQEQEQAEVLSVIDTYSKFTATERGSTAMDEKIVKEQEQAKISVIGTYCKFTATESGSTAMEEKMIKFMICLIRTKQVSLAYKEFEELSENERFIKRIVSEVYDIEEFDEHLLEFIDLQNDFKKKIMFMWALYEKIAMSEVGNEDTASILLGKITEISETNKMEVLCNYDRSQLKIIMRHLALISGEDEDIDYLSKKRDHKNNDMTVKEAFEEFSKSINENDEKLYDLMEKVDRKLSQIVKSVNTNKQVALQTETAKKARHDTSASVPARNSMENIQEVRAITKPPQRPAAKYYYNPK